MLHLALGYKTADYKTEIPAVLYLGRDRQKALLAAQKPGPGYTRATNSMLVSEFKIPIKSPPAPAKEPASPASPAVKR